jgi:hypothetical protein
MESSVFCPTVHAIPINSAGATGIIAGSTSRWPHLPMSPISLSADDCDHAPSFGWLSSPISSTRSNPSTLPGRGGSNVAVICRSTDNASSGDVRVGWVGRMRNLATSVEGEAYIVRA